MRRWMPIVLVVAGLATGLILSEAAYRSARRFVCIGEPDPGVWRHDDRYGWAHKPNWEGWHWWCNGRRFEWRVYTTINSHGLRDRERAYEKPPGTRRVLLLGDSITEAMQVPLESTFATLLESDLRARGEHVEVINAGVAGFGTDNELEFFRVEGVRYEPDVVVLVFNVVNDLAENSPSLHAKMYEATSMQLVPKTYYRLVDGDRLVPVIPAPLPPPPPISWWHHVADRLYLVRTLARIVSKPDVHAAAPVWNLTIYGATKTTPETEWEQSWAVTERLVRALRADVEHAGARFAVAVVPFREAVVPLQWLGFLRSFPELAATPHDPAYPVERMLSFLEHEGIPHLDLLPPLRTAAEQTGASGFYVADVHLDETGHSRVAASLAPFVASLIGEPPGAAGS